MDETALEELYEAAHRVRERDLRAGAVAFAVLLRHHSEVLAGFKLSSTLLQLERYKSTVRAVRWTMRKLPPYVASAFKVQALAAEHMGRARLGQCLHEAVRMQFGEVPEPDPTLADFPTVWFPLAEAELLKDGHSPSEVSQEYAVARELHQKGQLEELADHLGQLPERYYFLTAPFYLLCRTQFALGRWRKAFWTARAVASSEAGNHDHLLHEIPACQAALIHLGELERARRLVVATRLQFPFCFSRSINRRELEAALAQGGWNSTAVSPEGD